jgi:hypothetical protein
MRHVIVRYRVKKERVGEHEALIRAVFDELSKSRPTGLHYAAYKQPDGVSFVHVARVAAKENPLDSLAAFKAFTLAIRERCDEPPQAVDVTAVGAFGFEG